ncbi:sodium:alanine symporter family protein [Archangium violaceum]|uniref:alanine/glycine:cation symporter family protein n=1 Tax=Archangium violaceum TaxID=83451 RepID=UPI0019503FB9|nr:amino acid carrier protein [Archangium violaceum]QRN95371.1 sodium:alanine symporter family protein [Archangium violaceum]
MLPEPIRHAIDVASNAVWGPWTMALLLGTGVFLTVRLRFVQVARFRDALRAMVPTQASGAGSLSPFQAFMTALAASIGTGNIAGVATAIVSGGPGALFWIWVYGFFATAIKYCEAVLGIRYRQVHGERLSAGPMHYLKDGLGSPKLAWLYALIAGVAALTTTPFTQPNSMAVVLQSQFSIPPLASGLVIAVLTWLVVIGGVKSIGRAAERLAPLKVGLYLAGGLVVILTHAARLPEVFALVFREAFSLHAAGGGAAGVGMMVAMRYGIARGIYANEAGYGTAAVAYGTARTEAPVQQGLQAVMEVFIVSCVTSTISALVILASGAWTSGLTSTAVVAQAFNTAMPTVGGWIVAFCAFLFGYTTLIGWAYYGEQFLEYAIGLRVTLPYRWLYCGLVVFGAMGKVETIWAWGDLMNGLQVFPNLVGLIGLSGVAASTLRQQSKPQQAEPAAPVA